MPWLRGKSIPIWEMKKCLSYEAENENYEENLSPWNPRKLKASASPVGDALIGLTQAPNENRVDIAKENFEKSQAKIKFRDHRRDVDPPFWSMTYKLTPKKFKLSKLAGSGTTITGSYHVDQIRDKEAR